MSTVWTTSFEIAEDVLEGKEKKKKQPKPSTAGVEERRVILQRFQQNIATSLRMNCFIQREKNAYLKFTGESEWGWRFNEDSKQVLEIPDEIHRGSDGWKSPAFPDRADDGNSPHLQ